MSSLNRTNTKPFGVMKPHRWAREACVRGVQCDLNFESMYPGGGGTAEQKDPFYVIAHVRTN